MPLQWTKVKGHPELYEWVVTNPAHGGKVDCCQCGKWIEMDQDHRVFPTPENATDYIHEECYNPYDHYYGVNKGID